MEAYDLIAKLRREAIGVHNRAPDDPRIHVLWIEDRADQVQSEGPEIGDWFSVLVAKSPLGVTQLRDASPRRAGVAEPLPADVYIADFRFYDSATGYVDPALADLGGHAPAAGLLVGVMTALSYPDTVQHIIPNTAYKDELGQTWNLIWSFLPNQITVSDPSSREKLSGGHELWSQVASSYREAVVKAIFDERMVLAEAERSRLSQYVELHEDVGSIPVTPGHLWSALDPKDHPVVSLWSGVGPQSRAIKRIALGSLFYDQIIPGDNEYGVLPTSVLANWLENFDDLATGDAAAKELALSYWACRHGFRDCNGEPYIGSEPVKNAHPDGAVGLAVLTLLISYWTQVSLCLKVARLHKTDEGFDREEAEGREVAQATVETVRILLESGSSDAAYVPIVDKIRGWVTEDVLGLLNSSPSKVFWEGQANGVDIFSSASRFAEPLLEGNLFTPWGQSSAGSGSRTRSDQDLTPIGNALDPYLRKHPLGPGLAVDARTEIHSLMTPGWESMSKGARTRAAQNVERTGVPRNLGGVRLVPLLSGSQIDGSLEFVKHIPAAKNVAFELLGPRTQWPVWLS